MQTRLVFKTCHQAHDLNPVSAAGWYNSTLYYDFYRKGMYSKALEVLKLHPVQGLVETQNKYTAVYAELGDLDKAREHWEKCIEIDPEWSAQKSTVFSISGTSKRVLLRDMRRASPRQVILLRNEFA